MIKIKRSKLPVKCPKCGAKLKSYHSSKPIITRRVCVDKCSGYHVVAEIHHATDECFINEQVA